MTAFSRFLNTGGLIKALESVLTPSKVIVDVGGGQGAVASQALLDHPHLTAVVFDLV